MLVNSSDYTTVELSCLINIQLSFFLILHRLKMKNYQSKNFAVYFVIKNVQAEKICN